MIIIRSVSNAEGRRRTSLIFRATSTHRPMKFKRQGDIAMVLAIFVGGGRQGLSLPKRSGARDRGLSYLRLLSHPQV